MNQEILPALRDLVKGHVMVDEPMKNHTSFRIGGPADVMVVPRDLEDLRALVIFLGQARAPFFVMGNGTNLLVPDAGIRGVVIKIAGTLDRVELHDSKVTAGSGLLISALAEWARDHGWKGLEFAAGIPGTVGGAVIMNAGAYEKTMRDIVVEVMIMDYSGEAYTIRSQDLAYGHRESKLQQERVIVTSVTLVLEQGDREEIAHEMDRLLAERRSKQPVHLPSAGCIFKNPRGRGAGRFIEAAGLKGVRIGDAQVSERHANFIVNRGNATARDVQALIEYVRNVVAERCGVVLEPEVRIVGGLGLAPEVKGCDEAFRGGGEEVKRPGQN